MLQWHMMGFRHIEEPFLRASYTAKLRGPEGMDTPTWRALIESYAPPLADWPNDWEGMSAQLERTLLAAKESVEGPSPDPPERAKGTLPQPRQVVPTQRAEEQGQPCVRTRRLRKLARRAAEASRVASRGDVVPQTLWQHIETDVHALKGPPPGLARTR